MPCRKNDDVIITELEREETEATLRYQAEAENAKTKILRFRIIIWA